MAQNDFDQSHFRIFKNLISQEINYEVYFVHMTRHS